MIIIVIQIYSHQYSHHHHNKSNNNDDNNNNSIKFFIIYVPSQQLQGQLQTQHSVYTGNYIMDKHNIKSKTYYKNVITKNYIHRTLVVWTNIINNFRLMSINVIERNGSDCKYVEVFIHHVGSI
jgi:hypothetical protein